MNPAPGHGQSQAAAMRAYYRFQAKIYDATRWAFLFGRNAVLKQLPVRNDREQHLLEVGCGTGHNLRLLAEEFPNLQLTGLDVSQDMLEQAAKAVFPFRQRVSLVEQAYGAAPLALRPDFILFSYALTMFNPGWEQAILHARADLPEGGRIAVVDFHYTPSGVFRWWMGKNHVRMDGHLVPFLQSQFRTELLEITPAWMGLWRYFVYVGVKV